MSGAEHLHTKVFNDPLHGQIELHPLMVEIIDTPQFQRLRNIKQLGGAYYVFPGASHNRFEHSIGVGYLAGEMVESLKRNDHHKAASITDHDVLSIKIAGLCHDLGHGPFSHLFEKLFIPEVQKGMAGEPIKWKHEEASVAMFDYMIKRNNLKPRFKKFYQFQSDEGVDREIRFIKSLIIGNPTFEIEQQAGSEQEREQEDKEFLYEIVANEFTGIDVDKWDYFERDSHGLGVAANLDIRRSMMLARVRYAEGAKSKYDHKTNGRKVICMRDKTVYSIYEMFHTRFSLHYRAYQHKAVVAIELMIRDALVKANAHLKFPREDGTEFEGTMLEAALRIKGSEYVYQQLTDYVLQQIRHSKKKELCEAQMLLERLEKRDLYKCVGDELINEGNQIPTEEDIVKKATEAESNISPELIVVQVAIFSYGGSENPVDSVWFYDKDSSKQPRKIPKQEVSHTLPHVFKEKRVRVYCKRNEHIKKVEELFTKWWKDANPN